MPNEIDVKGLREKLARCQGQPSIQAGLAVVELPALLDEIERLRGYPSTAAREETDQRASDALAAAFRQRDAAETELSALKAKLAKVREWADAAIDQALEPRTDQYVEGFSDAGDAVLAILDGKEG